MQSNRFMAIIAAVAGLVATGLAFAYIKSSTVGNEAEPMVPVLFVTMDLPANHVINPDTDLKSEPVGVISAPGLAQSAIKTDELEALRGRRISAPLPAGVPLMYSHLAAIQDIHLAPGKRAMTISVGREGTLGGILVPGDHVDIIVSYEVEAERRDASGPGANVADVNFGSPEATLSAILSQITQRSSNPGRWEAREILQDVRVIAVGNRLNMSRQQLVFGKSAGLPSTASAVTIEVSSQEAMELIKATAGGANPVTLLLRPVARPGSQGTGSGLVVEEEGP